MSGARSERSDADRHSQQRAVPTNTRASGAQTERSERRERSRGAAERANILRSLQNLYRDTMAEIRKVSWPDTQTTRNLTLIVIGTAVALGALLGGIDALFVRVWEWVP